MMLHANLGRCTAQVAFFDCAVILTSHPFELPETFRMTNSVRDAKY